ncbi:hypothetical protein ACFS07_31035 [Undibacterium arcticum]
MYQHAVDAGLIYDDEWVMDRALTVNTETNDHQVVFEFNSAFYVKLGHAGCWEAESILGSRLRLGWPNQSLADINAGRWTVIAEQLRNDLPNKQQVTTGLNRLQDIARSTPEDVWITFHGAKLWWARLAPGPVEEDHISKFRATLDGWHDASQSGRLLVANDLPGKIAQMQGFSRHSLSRSGKSSSFAAYLKAPEASWRLEFPLNVHDYVANLKKKRFPSFIGRTMKP